MPGDLLARHDTLVRFGDGAGLCGLDTASPPRAPYREGKGRRARPLPIIEPKPVRDRL
jgi:hypothetical protein